MKYERLNKEATALFDFILEFWSNVEHGVKYSQDDYGDVEYAERVFRDITGTTIEAIDLDGE